MRSRTEMVKLLTSWIGKKESDGSYKTIIDIYNGYKGSLPRGLKMQYSWAWCACTWSAAVIKLGYTDICPIEISCNALIDRAKTMGIWVEQDSYVPKPGDAVLYDWNDSGTGDNTGWPDHVGCVDYVNEAGGYFTVIEGNYSDSVKKRTVSINGKFIRGFITPKYDTGDAEKQTGSISKSIDGIAREVIAGQWGNGETRKKRLTEAGYDYAQVQYRVEKILNGDAIYANKYEQDQAQPVEKKITATCYAKSIDKSLVGKYITTANLYCRNDAGNNKKALCCIPKGTNVQNYGYYTKVGSVKWLMIQFTMDGIQYTGFSSASYLKKV